MTIIYFSGLFFDIIIKYCPMLFCYEALVRIFKTIPNYSTFILQLNIFLKYQIKIKQFFFYKLSFGELFGCLSGCWSDN